MLTRLATGTLFVVMAAACIAVAAAPPPATQVATPIVLKSQDIRLPGPGAIYTGAGSEVLNQNCLMCHSPTFVDKQPALSGSAWQAEVLKMKNVFGAAIDPKQIAAIVQALVARHGLPTGGGEKEPAAAGASG